MMCKIHWVKISFAKIYRVEFEQEVNAFLEFICFGKCVARWEELCTFCF
jgi:hypothetical protein